MQVKKYQLENGVIPFDEWVDGLAPVFRARIYANLVKIELGNFGNVKSIEGKDAEDLFEQRMFFGPGFRTYFGKMGRWSYCCAVETRRRKRRI